MSVEIPRFLIDKLPLSDDKSKEAKHDKSEEARQKLKGYSVVSTAPINIENQHWFIEWNNNGETNNSETLIDANNNQLKEIVEHLTESEDSEITISIHGYSMKWQDAQKRNETIYKQAKNKVKNNQVFIGYRWQAENPGGNQPPEYYQKDENSKGYKAKSSKPGSNFINALRSLPAFLLGLSVFNIQLICLSLFLSFAPSNSFVVEQLGVLFLFLIVIYIVLKIFFNNVDLEENGSRSEVRDSLPFWLSIALITAFLCIYPDSKTTLLTLLCWSAIPFIATWILLLITNSSKLYRLFPLLMSLSITGLGILYLVFPWKSSLNIAYFVISFFILSIILTLIIVRLSNYFRDRYRASNYGVLDLVELIRHLDSLINSKNRQSRVKLNIIGHSMGCFVATNTIRILSDVFDPLAVEKNPTHEIGNSFSLGRLVLVAPDIPVESISSNLSNFLASSLRRCEEAYVFSSEADVVVRFASTAANFLSYPSRERFGGYRLGNITIKNLEEDKKTKKFGIANFNSIDIAPPSDKLELRASESEIKLLKKEKVIDNEIANKFTYFDCTDYSENKSLLSYGLEKRALSFAIFSDYFWLSVAQFLPPWLMIVTLPAYIAYLIYCSIIFVFSFGRKKPHLIFPRKINTHGAYFEGEFSQDLICSLAFLGFDNFINSLEPKSLKKIDVFDSKCEEKKIQVLLSKDLQKKILNLYKYKKYSNQNIF